MSRWKILKSKILMQAGFFKLREDRCELPDGRVMPRYYVFEFPEWVNVIPVTTDGKAVLIRQYRHGAEKDFLEIPGGTTDPHEIEDPRKAAERELREETGHQAAEWIFCGTHFPNPSLQANRMHTYLALGCEKVGEPALDPYEDLSVELVDLAEMIHIWENGGFEHSLISTSIGLAMKHLRKRGLIPNP